MGFHGDIPKGPNNYLMCSKPLSLKLYVACYVDNADLVISRVATVNSLSLSVCAAHNDPQEVNAPENLIYFPAALNMQD